MSSFAWKPTYYTSRMDYANALLPFAVPSWIEGVTLHHTYRPTQADWRGRKSMDALERFYRDTKKWSAAPHLFLAPDGIWAGTPLSHPGVHAGACNSVMIGLEIVGDFDKQPWDLGLRERVYALLVLLLHWMGKDERAVVGHRECLKNKSCPGKAINMVTVRSQLGERLFDQRFVVTGNGAIVRSGSYATAPIVRSAPRGLDVSAYPVLGKPHKGNARWARVRLSNGMRGYIWAGMGRFEAV
jgi:hypothetical protein